MESKQAGTQLPEMGYERLKLVPIRPIDMNVYQGPSTVVTDLNRNTQGEKLAATDLKKVVTNVAFELNSKDELNVKVRFQERKKNHWLA